MKAKKKAVKKPKTPTWFTTSTIPSGGGTAEWKIPEMSNEKISITKLSTDLGREDLNMMAAKINEIIDAL